MHAIQIHECWYVVGGDIVRLRVQIKQLGARGKKVSPVPFEIEGIPATAGDLIAATVKKCVDEYNERVLRGDVVASPLSERQIKDMADIGRITFGICYGDKQQDATKAVENAVQAFKDGIVCVFINDVKLSSPDEKIELKEDDVLSFIRLTMLAGRIW